MATISLIIASWDIITFVAGAAIAIFRLTKWGKANKAALDAVVGVIEQHDAEALKRSVRQAPLSKDALDVLDDAVAKVDVSKPNPSRIRIAIREIAKTIGLIVQKKR